LKPVTPPFLALQTFTLDHLLAAPASTVLLFFHRLTLFSDTLPSTSGNTLFFFFSHSHWRVLEETVSSNLIFVSAFPPRRNPPPPTQKDLPNYPLFSAIGSDLRETVLKLPPSSFYFQRIGGSRSLFATGVQGVLFPPFFSRL